MSPLVCSRSNACCWVSDTLKTPHDFPKFINLFWHLIIVFSVPGIEMFVIIQGDLAAFNTVLQTVVHRCGRYSRSDILALASVLVKHFMKQIITIIWWQRLIDDRTIRRDGGSRGTSQILLKIVQKVPHFVLLGILERWTSVSERERKWCQGV